MQKKILMLTKQTFSLDNTVFSFDFCVKCGGLDSLFIYYLIIS